ncbi:thioredoxin reductase glit [Xylariales sp. PMI_506]|nr:thioredoxin reductase glit [Xylariales sp. PMI_506]
MTTSLVDVLVLGAGPAGLAAAGGLARQLHTVIVFNSSKFRNARAKHMHNVPGWDHRPPSEFREKAKADILERYSTVQFRDVEVAKVEKLDNGKFRATDTQGQEYLGKKVVIATGVRDIMPDIPGYAELWGSSIFHCLFCHGYEERGRPSAGVLASGMLSNLMPATGFSRMAGRLADRINVYVNGNTQLATEVRAQLKSTRRFQIEYRRIVRLEKDPEVPGVAGVLVTLEDGTVNKEGFIASAPDTEQASPFAAQLGVQLTPQGHIETAAPFNATSVPGVFAAGDCATFAKAVPTAVQMGAMVASGIAHAIQAEEDVEE